MKIHAPFTEEQVKNLNAWQQSQAVHPFTCGNNRGSTEHRAYQAIHGGDLGQLVATKDGWVCLVCGEKQDWAHDFMCDGTLLASQNAFLKSINQPTDKR